MESRQVTWRVLWEHRDLSRPHERTWQPHTEVATERSMIDLYNFLTKPQGPRSTLELRNIVMQRRVTTDTGWQPYRSPGFVRTPTVDSEGRCLACPTDRPHVGGESDVAPALCARGHGDRSEPCPAYDGLGPCPELSCPCGPVSLGGASRKEESDD